jgi:hypothetical protein
MEVTMLRNVMSRNRVSRDSKLVVLVAVIALAFSTLAWAHDDDDYNRRDGGQYGYQNGYRDGIRHGRYDRSANYGYDVRSDQWEDAHDGYQRWMGSFGRYKQGYRQGYEKGYREGYSSVWGRGDGDRDDGYFNRERDGYGWGGGGNVAYNNGWNDGSSVAQSDLAGGKNYNSNPRGRYDDADHGYRREFGDKHAYKSQYTAGYRAGYDSVFSQTRSRW